MHFYLVEIGLGVDEKRHLGFGVKREEHIVHRGEFSFPYIGAREIYAVPPVLKRIQEPFVKEGPENARIVVVPNFPETAAALVPDQPGDLARRGKRRPAGRRLLRHRHSFVEGVSAMDEIDVFARFFRPFILPPPFI